MSAWYLLHCKARQEARAKLNIENQGINTCFPQISVQKIRRGKRTTVNEPLFPNYLFIQVDQDQANFNALRSTRGVSGFVRFGGVPAEVPDQVMQQLIELEASEELSNFSSQFEAGSRVQVEEGPFAGLQAVYQLAKGEERCLVLLDMLGKQQRIEIEERVLRAL
ncbi:MULTISPECIES: transcription/translation regulatory transformer protein RfaH [Gammaproteobacteria]|uniref:transcription/translation regulatory transformer protein RfaH n=1 Tax=Gammaproteobacteria TaxID=1236 RepID=UPI000DCF7BD0|nr:MULTISPECIES: transcription/translation regulatory transformer protein RfaH [Gammaproteobacteria]RTE86075.1 transcription/translation regulatory transformer protein RfaH [Aliidiomarina sp. B3213]TCZ91429.1 transcription/translation regulatory transformer protein RfaH [Lysobacter sp. N42]